MQKTVYLRQRQQQQPDREPIDTDSVVNFLKIAATIVAIGVFCWGCYYSVKRTREYFDDKFTSIADELQANKIQLDELEKNQEKIRTDFVTLYRLLETEFDSIEDNFKTINENLSTVNRNITPRF